MHGNVFTPLQDYELFVGIKNRILPTRVSFFITYKNDDKLPDMKSLDNNGAYRSLTCYSLIAFPSET